MCHDSTLFMQKCSVAYCAKYTSYDNTWINCKTLEKADKRFNFPVFDLLPYSLLNCIFD